ncbi:protein kinase [bacterium]|nr:protein kinase [bacterium]
MDGSDEAASPQSSPSNLIPCQDQAATDQLASVLTAAEVSKFRASLFARIDEQTRQMKSTLAQVPETIRSGARFELQHKIGGGGLGDVYQAFDRHLQRVVALKVSKNRASLPRRRDRFMQEYRVTAKLQHPGIPAVYAAGRLENGRRFYAMRLVQGQTLTARTRVSRTSGDLAAPLDLRSLLQIFKQVCDTVDAAHEAGYLHLDLKPDNVVIEPHGATFVVDWGLARRYPLRQRTPAFRTGNSGPRSTGIAGTIEFMAPEQFSGDVSQFGPGTDIYALGGILQYLLTGQPPRRRPAGIIGSRFWSFIRSACASVDSSTLDVACDVAIPELASVCRRALAPQSPRRYSSARELREEIERWEHGADVLAHRDHYTLTERISRFSIRHARTLMISTLSLVILMTAFGIAGWQQARAARFELAAERAQTEQRTANEVALAALEQQIAGVQRQEILRQPELLPLRIDMLRSAWTQYETWAVTNLADHDLRMRLIQQLHQLIAMVEASISELALLNHGIDHAFSQAIAQRALDVSRELVASTPEDPLAQRLLARSLLQCASQAADAGDVVTAESLSQEAISLWSRLVDHSTTCDTDVDEWIRSQRFLSGLSYSAAMQSATVDERQRLLRDVLDLAKSLQERVASLEIDPSTHGRELAALDNQLGIATHKLGDPGAAMPHFESAQMRLRPNASLAPEQNLINDDWIALRRLQAQILNNYGLSLRATRSSQRAITAHQEARQIRTALLEAYPWLLSVRSELAQSLGNLADTLVDLNDTAAEITTRQDAVHLLEQMQTDYPSMQGLKEFWGLHKVRITMALHRSGQDHAAAECFQETLAIIPQPELAEPTNYGHLLDVALGHCLIAQENDPSQQSLAAATDLILRCAALNGFEDPTTRSRFMTDDSLAAVRQHASIRPIWEKLASSAE